jgi:Protein of unknown function (DUF3991)
VSQFRPTLFLPDFAQSIVLSAVEIGSSPLQLEMPSPNKQRWSSVRKYLTETRKLSGKLIDSLHERSLIYADDSQNIVFVRYATTS